MSNPRAEVRPASSSVVWTVIGLCLLAVNMRPALGSVSPLLGDIQDALGLSDAAASVLTTLPVLCLGVFAAAAPGLARRLGLASALVLGLVVLVAGVLIRLVPSTAALFIGTTLAGAGLAIGNVLMPAVIKTSFPTKIRLFTGIGTAILSGGAALSAGVAVPLRNAVGGDWNSALAVWAVPAVIALVPWFVLARRSAKPAAPAAGGAVARGSLRGDALSWQVTGYLALRALVFFTALGWLPMVLSDFGYSEASSGALLSLTMAVSVPGALFAPVLAGRFLGMRAVVAMVATASAASLIGLLAAPGIAALWVVVLGISLGAGHALALTFIGLRSPDPQVAAQLSGMVQTVGYLVGALAGPFALGIISGATGSWTVPLILLAAFTVPELILGLLSSRDRFVRPRTDAAPAAKTPVREAARVAD
ncbi:MFS transporter [Kitasatospora sp. NBC_00070]|uniref:MFS transporter n=1 Tax=Kitasatospora sp. NBC_00070 TaxID=2975962 RepID=UPI00324E87B3